ncbi:MAG TPA: hypothetical protein VNW26_02400 [Steroidobacteraceae bacterium]|nr:hypothetical protein [Steroidobacteraceae bacterium]
MAAYEHIVKSYNVGDLLDDIASADPPAYLRRCFAEGCSAPSLSWRRVQQLALCAMVLDAIVSDREYEFFEHELIADWRIHYASACAKLKDTAALALRRVVERDRPEDPDAVAELEQLARSLGSA